VATAAAARYRALVLRGRGARPLQHLTARRSSGLSSSKSHRECFDSPPDDEGIIEVFLRLTCRGPVVAGHRHRHRLPSRGRRAGGGGRRARLRLRRLGGGPAWPATTPPRTVSDRASTFRAGDLFGPLRGVELDHAIESHPDEPPLRQAGDLRGDCRKCGPRASGALPAGPTAWTVHRRLAGRGGRLSEARRLYDRRARPAARRGACATMYRAHPRLISWPSSPTWPASRGFVIDPGRAARGAPGPGRSRTAARRGILRP